MKIQVVGPGCPRCQLTEKNVLNACAQLDIAADITHVTEMQEIVALGVMRTPAVIIDGRVVLAGKVPSVGELKAILSDAKPC